MSLAHRRARKLFFERLEDRSLLAGDIVQFPGALLPSPPESQGFVTLETPGAEGESDSAIPDRVTNIYWDAAQLILSGKSDQLPKPTVPSSSGATPGYSMDTVQYDEQFRLATDLHVLAITPELLGNLSGLNFVYRNTYSPPNTGPVLGDALTYSRIQCWLHPSDLERVLQLDYVMWIDFSTRVEVWGRETARPAAMSITTLPNALDDAPSGSTTTSGGSLDQIDDRVIAAFAGDPSVAIPRIFTAVPANSVMPGIEGADRAAGMFGVVEPNGTLYVQIDYLPGDGEYANLLEANGVNVGSHYDQYGIMEAWLKEPDLTLLSQHPSTKRVALPSRSVVWTGTWQTAGDTILNASEVRTRFATLGVNGSGVKVGVISDGVAHLANAVASGDLPGGASAVIVNPTLPGMANRDEGTAMLEIIHDLAPGASLYFS